MCVSGWWHVMRVREWVHGDGVVLQLDKVSKELMKTQRQMMRGTLSDAEQEVVVGRVAELEKEAGRLRKVVKASSQPPSRAASPTPEARREQQVPAVGTGDRLGKEAEQEQEADPAPSGTHGGVEDSASTSRESAVAMPAAGDISASMAVSVESVAEGGSGEVDAEEQVRA